MLFLVSLVPLHGTHSYYDEEIVIKRNDFKNIRDNIKLGINKNYHVLPETSANNFQMSQTTGAGGFPSLSFNTPIILIKLHKYFENFG